MADVREKLLNEGFATARKAWPAFWVGLFLGLALAVFGLGFAIKNMPNLVEQWGWMPESEQQRLQDELKQTHDRADALQKKHDQLTQQNEQFAAQLADHHNQELRCAQWNNELTQNSTTLLNDTSKLATDEGELSNDDMLKDDKLAAVNGEKENIAAVRLVVQNLHAQVLEDCNFAHQSN